MSNFDLQQQLAGKIRPLQIIVCALVAGCLAFLAVVVMLQAGGEAADEEQSAQMITWIGLAFSVAALVARLVVPGVVAGAAIKQLASKQTGEDATQDQMLEIYQARTIVAAAILEGPCFFCLIAYMLEGAPLALVAAGVLIVGVASHFPTASRVANWIDQQAEVLRQERSLAGG